MQPVIFLGSPAVAIPSLRVLAAHADCRVVGVFSQPVRPFGRGRAKKMRPSPVRAEAESLGLSVFTPERIGGADGLEALQRLQPVLAVVCAYGQIFPEQVLQLPPLGCFNLHFSLLPHWRGASPVQAAILAGDAVTGVSLQKMVQKLDAGPIVAHSAPVTIAPQDNAESLAARLAESSGVLLNSALPAMLAGTAALHPQDESMATECRTIPKTAGAVDWSRETAVEIERKLRAFTPWPGCHCYLGGRRLGLVRLEVVGPVAGPEGYPPAAPGVLHPGGFVAAREGWVRLLEVKPEGKGAMPFAAFINGAPAAAGSSLTPEPAIASIP